MSNSTYFSFFIVLSFLGITLSLIYSSIKLGITPTPTSPSVKKALTTLLPDKVFGEIHELGSGWGSLLSAIKRQYPNNQVFAHERSPIPRLFSRLATKLLKTDVNITNQDIFAVNLSKSGLVLCYLYPAAMAKFSSHFRSELPNNCWIISHTFHLPGWKPVKEIYASDIYRTRIYLYKKDVASLVSKE